MGSLRIRIANNVEIPNRDHPLLLIWTESHLCGYVTMILYDIAISRFSNENKNLDRITTGYGRGV